MLSTPRKGQHFSLRLHQMLGCNIHLRLWTSPTPAVPDVSLLELPGLSAVT
jgi:hypothetical protein